MRLPNQGGALVAVRVRSEGEMAAPCGFSIWTEKLYDGQARTALTSLGIPGIKNGRIVANEVIP